MWRFSVNRVWPAWANTMQAQYRDVTVVQLLAHQTGLPVDITVIPSPERIEDGAPGTLPEKRLIWAAELLNLVPANPVGTYVYTNAGNAVCDRAGVFRKSSRPPLELEISKLFPEFRIVTQTLNRTKRNGTRRQPGRLCET
jgi:hypothetical protein